jgi:hypothetical protein
LRLGPNQAAEVNKLPGVSRARYIGGLRGADPWGHYAWEVHYEGTDPKGALGNRIGVATGTDYQRFNAETKAGEEKHALEIAGGGRVTYRTGVDLRHLSMAALPENEVKELKEGQRRAGEIADLEAIRYHAPETTLAAHTHWLRFLWREVIAVGDDPSQTWPYHAMVRPPGKQPYPLCTAPVNGAPPQECISLDVDTKAESPYYDESPTAVVERDPAGVTIYDRAGDQRDLAREARRDAENEHEAHVNHVIARAHFNTFLIRTGAEASDPVRALFELTVTEEWKFDALVAEAPPSSHERKTAARALNGELPQPFKKAFDDFEK